MLVKEESTRGWRRLPSGYRADGDSRSNRSAGGKTSTLNVSTLKSGNDKQISGKRRRQHHEYLLLALVASKPSLTFVLPRQTRCSLCAHQKSDRFNLSYFCFLLFENARAVYGNRLSFKKKKRTKKKTHFQLFPSHFVSCGCS